MYGVVELIDSTWSVIWETIAGDDDVEDEVIDAAWGVGLSPVWLRGELEKLASCDQGGAERMKQLKKEYSDFVWSTVWLYLLETLE